MMNNVAGVVVLYHPGVTVLENIRSYSKSIKKLYVIDNTEQPSEETSKALYGETSNIEYIAFKQNLGIATALNFAAVKASGEGYEWLLTMDQDSCASKDMVKRLLKGCETLTEEKIGIIAPKYLQQKDDVNNVSSGLEEVDVTITSGNLLNLKAFRIAGPFREDFFIDYVDHEYCLRLKLHGFKIIINKGVILNHALGATKRHAIMRFPMISSHHNFIRRYYITRNRLAVLKEYKDRFPKYYSFERAFFFKETLKILFFEDDKFRKVKSIIQGYLDFKRNRFGKYKY